MRVLLALLFVAVQFSAFAVQGQLNLLKCDAFTIKDGLPQSFVETVFQDEKGFLWIATQDGISRYNGYGFENFFSNPFDTTSIINNYIIKIDQWGADSILFTSSMGFSLFNGKTKVFKNYKLNTNDYNIENIRGSLVLRKGQLMLISKTGVFEVDFTKTGVEVELKSANSNYRQVMSFNGESVFVADKFISVLRDDELTQVITDSMVIRKAFALGDELFVQTQTNLLVYNSAFVLTKTIPCEFALNDIEQINGDYWLATKNDGLKILSPAYEFKEGISRNAKNTFLLSKHVKDIFVDQFNIIWLGTDKGLNKIDQSKKQFLQFKPSLYNLEAADNCWSFYENDSLFFAGFSNGLQIQNKSTKQFDFLPFNGLVLAITEFNGQLLLGTNKGVWAVNHRDSLFTLDSIAVPAQIKGEEDIVLSFHQHNNHLFIGSLNYLTICDANLAIKNRWEIKNVRAFASSGNDVYFAAQPSGIHKIYGVNDTSFSGYKKQILHEIDHLLTLDIHLEGKYLWMGLYGGGLMRYNLEKKQAKHFSTKNGLPNNTIYTVVQSGESLWLSTNGGLSKFNLKKETFENYNITDGLQSLEFNSGAALKSNSGLLYFGGINGYNIVQPKKSEKNIIPPKAYITSLYYNNVDLLNAENQHLTKSDNGSVTIEIPYYRNSFTIKVDGIHYSAPSENVFATQLEGWQQDWLYNKAKRTYTFSNLKGGDYYFKVKVANPDGTWSYNEKRLHIFIRPPVYETWWFISIASLVFGSIIFFFVYTRVNRSKLQRKFLEEKIKDRTREVEEQKRELETKNKDLEEEKNKEEEVLLNVLPRETARELVSTGKSTPRSYKMATVMFADFKNFTKITENLGPKELVAELDDSFAKFDDIVTRLNIEKIKTSGDAYMCVGGVPIRNQTNPVDCVLAAFQFQKYMQQKRDIRDGTGKPQWHLRIGMHTGALVAGVVGKKKFLYDVWGDTVNTAARMETSCDPDKTNISGTTYEYIKDYFDCEYRGKLPVKNKGAIDMYYVVRIKKGLCKDEATGLTPNRKFFDLLNFNVYTQQNYLNVRDYFLNTLKNHGRVNKLQYHGPHHTLDVIEAAERIGRSEGLSEEDLMLVKVAALFHDSGFLNKYDNNEIEGAKLARRELPRYGFTDQQVEIVEEMILATQIPQKPKNHLEEILCDADLDYLGRSKEEFEQISGNLAAELVQQKKLKTIEMWDPIQVKFLEAHTYFTKTCKETRRPGKIERLREIKARLNGPNEA